MDEGKEFATFEEWCNREYPRTPGRVRLVGRGDALRSWLARARLEGERVKELEKKISCMEYMWKSLKTALEKDQKHWHAVPLILMNELEDKARKDGVSE